MAGGRYHHNVITGAYDREHLISQGRANGVDWQEHKNPDINWFRFSTALHRHLDKGGQYHMDTEDPETLKQMLESYKGIRDLHKKTMIPHVRSAMAKLHSEHGDGSKSHMDFLKDSYSHLEANGGHHWSQKVSVLNGLNNHINSLTQRLNSMGHKV
ncbi:hypothetical protein D3C74_55260 [compost metagenome]